MTSPSSYNTLPPLSLHSIYNSVTLTIRKIEQELLAAGHYVLILTTKSGDETNTDMDGTHPNRQVLFLDNSIPIPFLEDAHNPAVSYHFGYSLSRKVRDQLDQFEPSIMHITVPDNLCLHLIQYARDKEIPLMGTYHSNIPDYMDHYPGLSWLKPLLATFFLHQYCFLQSLLVPTPYIHRHLSDTYHLDEATNLKIWGRGIDLEQFSPAHRSLKFRQILGIENDVPVICWVGRCVPEKRTDVFCNVILRLHQRNIAFHAIIVGRGPSEDELKNLPNTTFIGWLQGLQLSTAYASSDVFLFPSAVETFGNVTLEAAASGLPLVVEGGCSGHLVNHGVNGFACTNEESFFQATYELVTNDEFRHEAAKASRQHALKYEKRAIVQEMLQHYSRVTDEFYCDYGGHHENRDFKYLSAQHGFVGGSHPRPGILACVEFIFITAFRVMTWLWVGFVWFHARVLSQMMHMTGRARPVAAAPVRAVKAPPKPLPLQQANAVEMTLMEEGGYEHDDDDDGETSVTASIGESTALSTDSEASNATTSSSGCGGFSCIGFLDGPFVNGLSAGIIRMIALQCRVESTIRNSFTRCKRRTALQVPKRKDSNMLLTPPSLHRGRSNDSESSDGSRLDDTLKRRLRRSSPILWNGGAEGSP